MQCSAPDRHSYAALELLIDLLYTLSGTCKYGAACRYAHVDATKTGAKTSRKVRPGRDSGLSPMDVSTGVGGEPPRDGTSRGKIKKRRPRASRGQRPDHD